MLVLVALVHLVVLYAPSSPSGGGVPHLDKAVHVAVFAAVAVCARWCGLPRSPVVVALLAHAVLSEVVQGVLLSGRSADPLDAVADVVGVVLGALVPVPGARRAGSGAGATRSGAAGTMSG